MNNNRFSIVNLATGQHAIYDNSAHRILNIKGIIGGENDEDLQVIFSNAISILNSLNVEDIDFSSLKITRQGVSVNEHFYRMEDSEEFQDHFNAVATAQQNITRNVDQFGRDRITAITEQSSPSEDLSSRNMQPSNQRISPKTKKIFDILGRSFWRVILYKIAAVFFKHFPKSKFVKQHYVKPQKKLAKQYLAPTSEKIEQIRNYSESINFVHTLVPSRDKPTPVLPEALLTTTEMRDSGKLHKKIGGPKAYQMNLHDHVDSFQHGQFSTTGYCFRNGNLTEDAIVPTSANYSDNPEDADHLINSYVTTFAESEVAVIRSGVVDSSQRAEELKKLVIYTHEQSANADKPIRFVSHQLNSPEVSKEKMMIHKQHALVTSILSKDENITVAHLNSPCNRFYNWTRKGVPFKGEQQSHELNVEGMMQYCLWMLEDMIDNPNLRIDRHFQGFFKDTLEKINKKLSQAAKLYKEIEELESEKNEIKNLITELNVSKESLEEEIQSITDEIFQLENDKAETEDQDLIVDLDQKIELKTEELELKNNKLEEVKNNINGGNDLIADKMEKIDSKLEEKKEIEQQIQDDRESVTNIRLDYSLFAFRKQIDYNITCLGNNGKDQELLDTLKILNSLLGSQLEVKGKKLDRNHELLLFYALDKKLNVISAINCKSGLDRTGFIHALFTAAIELPENKFYHLIQHWDELSRKLNRMHFNNKYDPEEVLAEITKDLNEEDLRLVFELKNRALEHFLSVSLPITGVSTGIIGGKYGSGLMSANLLPLNCFPPVVYVEKEDGTVERVLIINYDKKGKVKGLTSDGRNLITQLSPNRGT